MSLHSNCQRAVDRIAEANAPVPCDHRAEIEVLLDRVILRAVLFREVLRDEPRIAGARKVEREHESLLPERFELRGVNRVYPSAQGFSSVPSPDIQ